MAKRSIVHVEIPANNQEEAARFYHELFDFETQAVPEMDYTTFMTGNVGGGFPTVPQMAAVGEVTIYLSSDDIEGDLRRIESMGGKILMPKTEIPNTGWFAIFSDPTGNKIGLYTNLGGPPG